MTMLQWQLAHITTHFLKIVTRIEKKTKKYKMILPPQLEQKKRRVDG